MLNIEYKENIDEDFYITMDKEFEKFAVKNDVICNYTPFGFVAKEDNKIVGMIAGH